MNKEGKGTDENRSSYCTGRQSDSKYHRNGNYFILIPVWRVFFMGYLYECKELKSVYLIATRDLSNLWLQFFLSQNQGFMRLFEKTVLK